MLKNFLNILLLLFCVSQATGQGDFRLELIRTDPENGRVEYRKKYRDAHTRDLAVADIITRLHNKAYLEARCDSIRGDSSLKRAYVYKGPRYYFGKLRTREDDHINDKAISPSALRTSSSGFTLASRDALLLNLLQKYENRGYPFARVWLDSIVNREYQIDALVMVSKGPVITVDSLIPRGTLKISRAYINRYLGIRPGSLYDESKIRKIAKRLEDIPFASVSRPYEVAFWEDYAKVFLYLDKKKASSFSGIIAVAPSSQSTGKLMINGDVKLRLLNSFAQGELIDLNWRSLEKGTQDLRLQLSYPFLLSTPLGLDYTFTLYKKDTSFLSLDHRIGIRYQYRGSSYLQVFAHLFDSDIIKAAGLEYVTVLPEFADISKDLFGLAFHHEALDYRMNPRKGLNLDLNVSAGLKTIKRNDRIPSVLYDSIDLKTSQFQGILNAEVYIPLFRRQTLLTGIQAGYLWNELLFENELFRIGGLKSLRGFDEESIKAGLYSVLLIEYRYLFERNSYLALFWNGAYVEKNTISSYSHDLPYGLGAGVSFDTRLGIFSLYYALGSSDGNPLLFKQSKIHFGITAVF